MKNAAGGNTLATSIGYNGLVTVADDNAVSVSEVTYAVPAGYAQHAASILNTAALAEGVTNPSSNYVMQLFYSDSSCTSGNFKGAICTLKLLILHLQVLMLLTEVNALLNSPLTLRI
jgi:hypothetical protein